MSNNGNIDIELLAGLDVNASEQEIRRAIAIIQSRLKGNTASIKIDADFDDKAIKDTLNKLQTILKTKNLSIDTQDSIRQIQREVTAMMNVATSANKAAKEKLEFTNANRRVERSAKASAEAITAERDAMNSLGNVDDILNRINAQCRQTNNVFQQFGVTLREAFTAYTAANLLQDAIREIINSGREAVDTVKELNDAATSLRMATGGSMEYVKALVQQYNAMGQELGAITTSVSDAADAWLRQGHTVADTNELIKDSMMLSKIAAIDSADSTKYLTSVMQGYRVAAEDVVDIVSKLSAVDLESATDAAGLAEAMSRTSESARIAGISMDRLIGMVATTGEITQKSMSSIGESVKTILSRVRDVKDGKLSIIGDDGEVENISNVEIVLNQLGIKLRESNLEFRNFQDVLDDVAASWGNYSSVQKAAIAKAFSGVRNQENFLVMMEHWDKVKEYTDIAANSQGVAEEKFGYYLESLEAKTNALKASLENLAATTISDELYGSILDVTKGMVDATAASGVLKGALAGLATAGSIYAFEHLAGYLNDAIHSFANLNEAMNMVNTAGTVNLNRLIDLTSGLSQSQTRLLLSTNNLNDAQRIAILRAQGMSVAEARLQLQTWGVTAAQQGAAASTLTFSSAMRGLYLTLAANPLFVVATAVTLGVTLWGKYKSAQEEAAQAAEQSRQKYDTLADEVSSLNTELETTKQRLEELNAIGLDNLSLVEQEEYDKLIKTNDELQRELRIKEALAKVALQEAAQTSSAALAQESQNSIGQADNYGNSKKVDNITYLEELVDRAERQRELMEDAKAELMAFEDSWTGTDIDMVKSKDWQYLNDVLTNAEDAIGKTESSISSAYEAIETDAKGLVDSFGNVVDGYEDMYSRVEGVRNRVDTYFNPESKETTKASLEAQFGKTKVSMLSDKDLGIAYSIRNIGDMDFDDLKQAIADVKKEADENIEIKVSTATFLSDLEQLSEGFDQLDSIYSDIKDKGDFDFGSLIDEKFVSTFGSYTEQYQKFVDVVSKSPTDIKACQSAFDDLVSAWFYGQEPLKNITDETYDLTVAWLKQQGVANAVEIADYALAQSKTAAWLAGQDLTQITAEEIEKFYEENEAAGITKSGLYQLQIQMIQTNQTGLSFEQQIGALQRLAINAGVASDAISNIFSKSPSVRRENMLMANAEGMSYEDYTLKRTSNAVSYQIQKTLKDLNNSAPKINYGGGSKSNAASKSGGSGGSKGSSSSKEKYVAEIDKYKDLTDAVDEVETKIKQLDQVYDHTDSLEGQIALKDKLIGLYKEEQDALTALNNARDKEISQNVKDLRAVGFKIEYDPKTDNLKIKNREYLNSLSQDTIQKYEKLLKATEDLNDANKESAEKWTELTYSIADVGKEITELRIKQYDSFVRDKEHLLDLLGNRKDTIGMDLSVYDDLMKGTLRTWQYLVKDGYEKNKEQIQDLEKTWMDYYDARIEREKEILEKQLDDHDKALDAVLDFIDDQLDGLDDQIDALKKINDERREALELQKAQIALDKARNQKTRKVLRKGKGYVYEADEDAIREAEENIAEKQYEASVKQLENQKENLEELKKVWSEIPDLFEKYQNELLASQILGADWEQKILDGREDTYEDFKDAYFDLQEEIQNKSDELENHMNQSYINMVEIFRKMADLYGNMNNISGKSWYVNKDGKAPSQAQVGDIIYTKGGTYQITNKDENGKFTSTKLDDKSTDIKDGMWGTLASNSNAQLSKAIGSNTLSNQNIVDTANDQIDSIYESITGMEVVGKYLANNTYFTQEEINTLAKHMGITDLNTGAMNTNVIATDANTDSQDENTASLNNATGAMDNLSVAVKNMAYAQAQADAYNTNANMKEGVSNEKWLKYWDDVLNFSDKTGLLTQEEVNNALAQRNKYQELVNQEKAIQDMVNGVTGSTLKVDLSDEDKEIIKSLQDAYNTAKAAGNEQGMELAHQLAEAVRNGFDISPITSKPDYKLSDTTYTGGASAGTGNKSNLQKDYEWELSKAKEFGASKDYISRLENAIARETYGSGSKIDTYTDEFGRTSTIINAADKSELNMSADDLKNRYDAGWRPVNDGMDKLGGNLKETNNTLSDNSDAMYDNTDTTDRNTDATEKQTAALEKGIDVNVNVSGGIYSDDSSGGSGGKRGSSVTDSAEYKQYKYAYDLAKSQGNETAAKIAKDNMDRLSSSSSKNSSRTETTNNSNGGKTVRTSNGSKTTVTTYNKDGSVKSSYTTTSARAKVKKKAKGGHNLVEDIYNVDEYGRKELLIQPTTGRYVHLSQGSTVIPADATKNLWDFGENPTQYMENTLKRLNNNLSVGGETINHYHIQELSLPNVVDGKEFWENMTQNLPNDAAQWAHIRR